MRSQICQYSIEQSCRTDSVSCEVSGTCIAAGFVDITTVSTAEQIFEKAKSLPDPMQAEALRFVEYLQSLKPAQREQADWTRFSAEQLSRQYCEADAVYDSD